MPDMERPGDVDRRSNPGSPSPRSDEPATSVRTFLTSVKRRPPAAGGGSPPPPPQPDPSDRSDLGRPRPNDLRRRLAQTLKRGPPSFAKVMVVLCRSYWSQPLSRVVIQSSHDGIRSTQFSSVVHEILGQILAHRFLRSEVWAVNEYVEGVDY